MREDIIGVNLVGYICSEHGVGESARHVASALDKTGLQWCAYDFEVNNQSRKEDGTWKHKISDKIQYPILLMNINADQIPVAHKYFGDEIWNNSYKIGIWYWELSEFPERWHSSVKLVDEIWAPTRFIQDAVSMKSERPVIYMPLPMSLQYPESVSRKKFGLPEDAFLFLNMYDTLSIQSRKNPAATISAFQQAFQPDDYSVGLVIKLNNSTLTEKDLQTLYKLVGEYKNIYILPVILTRIEVSELILACDVSVSLHRSEGLGLLCQEAMYFGKPVIATNYSGNTDFMSNQEACMVDYKLVPVGQDFGPYEHWQKWADADVESAVNYMKNLYEDRTLCQIKGKCAQKRIQSEYSPRVCADKMEKRIQFIRQYILEKERLVSRGE